MRIFMVFEIRKDEEISAEQPTPPSPIFQGNYLIFPLPSFPKSPKSQAPDYKIVDLNAVKTQGSMCPDINANEQESSEDTPKTQWQELSIYSSSPLTKKELDSPCRFDSTESEPGTPWIHTTPSF